MKAIELAQLLMQFPDKTVKFHGRKAENFTTINAAVAIPEAAKFSTSEDVVYIVEEDEVGTNNYWMPGYYKIARIPK